MSEGAPGSELEERWQEVGRVARRIDPLWFSLLLAAAEAQAGISNETARIDESYIEP